MTQSSANQGFSRRRILVADDDHITRLFMDKMLGQAGYGADLVANGQEAIRALESRHYDLLILDCHMPVMDGFATSQCIRSTTSKKINNAIPIIALSGLASEADRARCLEAGMDSVLSKPVDLQTLVSAIEQYLGQVAVENPDPRQNDVPGQTHADEFLDTLIVDFAAEIPQFVAALQRALRDEDVAELMNLAHRLRGVTGFMKISTLSTQSAALENAGKAEDLALASRLTPELIEELNKLAAALDA